jgi:hypothetical protein
VTILSLHPLEHHSLRREPIAASYIYSHARYQIGLKITSDLGISIIVSRAEQCLINVSSVQRLSLISKIKAIIKDLT